jgi:cell division control protein 6
LKSGRAVISGPIGTGKTLLAKQIDYDIYVNCYSNKSEYKILEEILRSLKPSFSPAGLTTQRLWKEIRGDHLIILDEIDGILPEDLQHFAYTLSRQPEIAQRIRYIAITRSAVMLKQMIQDPAIWSTFAEKAVVELEPYSHEEIRHILRYRAQESLHPDTCTEELLSLIAHIAALSPGHMRTGIDLLRNAALVAEAHHHDIIEPEDVREANQEGWIGDLKTLQPDPALVLSSVALACKKQAYVTLDDITEKYLLRCEEHNLPIKKEAIKSHLKTLIDHGFVHNINTHYTILDYPSELLIQAIDKQLKQQTQ